ncbi:MAG: ABC transporter ATP-binding protein [Geminicoccaceae bacterium]
MFDNITELLNPPSVPEPIERQAHGSLRVRGLSHRFADRLVLDHVDLSIGPGEVHCLIGPSGCGKTTTLRLIAGLEEVQAGEIDICDRRVAQKSWQLPAERRKVGLMFQDYALFPHLSVAQNIAFGIRHLPKRDRERKVTSLLQQVDMERHAAAYPHRLSGGEQQRVALARALAPDPCLMLLDEAFSSLDTYLRAEVRETVMRLVKDTGTPTLLVTHDADEAVAAADQIHIMQAGRILQSGSPEEIYERPSDLFCCSFFGPVRRFKSWAVGGSVSTPMGDIPRPELGDGTAVDVVVRPDATTLLNEPEPGSAVGRIVAVRRAGPDHWAELAIAGWTVTTRVPPGVDASVGAQVAVRIDQGHVFIYSSS